MNWVRRFLVWAFRIWGGKFAATHMRRKGLIVYLRALQAIRKSVLFGIAFFALIQLMLMGLIGSFVTGVFLTNQDLTAKLWILLAGFLVIFSLPFVGLAYLFSEKTWLKASGAQQFFAEQQPQSSENEAPESTGPLPTYRSPS